MKQMYHSDLLIQHQLGLLGGDVCKTIPKSTLYSWKNRDLCKLVGSENTFSDEKIELIKNFLANQTLLKAAKGLFFVYSTWISIAANVRGMKTLFRKSKEEIIKTIDFVVPLMGLKHACKLFKISENQFYAWKRKITCLLSPLNKCLKQSTQNISPSELQMAKTFVQNEQYRDYPLTSVYYEMMRKEKAFMSLTSFYKYAKFFDNIVHRKIFKTKQKTGIRATKPKEIIHADACVYRPLDYTKCFIYFIVDNFSRMILGWKISTEYKSSIMLDNLRNVYSEYIFEKEKPPTILMVDDGIENKGFVCKAIENKEIKLNKLIAQKDIRFSNSMVEAVNKRMKYDFLFRNQLLDIEHTQRFLETAVEQYNNRPHSALYGFTPLEVFNGARPDKYFFKAKMEQAKVLRIVENKALSCDSCAFTAENQE
jgi:transposase InsO family protein